MKFEIPKKKQTKHKILSITCFCFFLLLSGALIACFWAMFFPNNFLVSLFSTIFVALLSIFSVFFFLKPIKMNNAYVYEFFDDKMIISNEINKTNKEVLFQDVIKFSLSYSKDEIKSIVIYTLTDKIKISNLDNDGFIYLDSIIERGKENENL